MRRVRLETRRIPAWFAGVPNAMPSAFSVLRLTRLHAWPGERLALRTSRLWTSDVGALRRRTPPARHNTNAVLVGLEDLSIQLACCQRTFSLTAQPLFSLAASPASTLFL